MALAIEEKAKTLNAKRAQLEEFFKSHKDDAGNLVMTKAETEDVQAKNKELVDLQAEYEAERTLVEIEKKNRFEMEQLNAPPSNGILFKGSAIDTRGYGTDGASLISQKPDLGRMLVESKSYKSMRKTRNFQGCGVEIPDLETKTVFSTAAGWSPFVTRLPGAVLSPQQQPRIIDAIPLGTTTEAAIKFMLETTFTNNAAAIAEQTTTSGTTFGESAIALTEQLMAVSKIATFLPMTDEQLADVPGARDYVNNRLELMMKQKLDQEIYSGAGTGAHLTGLTSISGTQTFAKASGDDTITAIMKAMVLVQTVGFAEPSAIIFHPTNWMNVETLRTTDGIYIWGHPSTPGPRTLWGLPIITSTYATLNTGIVADFATYFMLYFRQGLEMLISNSHSDWFVRGIQAIRATLRAAMVCLRATALCSVTSLT